MARGATIGKGSRSDMERDVLSHPGFAHQSEPLLLDHVSSGLAYCNREVAFGSDDAQYRGAVFSYIASLLGIHCCLCGAVRDAAALRTSLPFCKWLCGDFDGTSLSGARTHPLCDNCNSAVVCFSAKHHKTGWGRSCSPVVLDEEFPILLLSLYSDRVFRSRVESHAAEFGRLRFDPRVGRRHYRVAA